MWSLVAFIFPTLAIVKDDSVVLAMLLFVLETLLAAALLAARLLIPRRPIPAMTMRAGGCTKPARCCNSSSRRSASDVS